jgi:predicted alpha/beta hydrolase family esterase
MADVFIIHGTRGRPEVNWYPWLKEQLEALGQTVIIPRFPTPQGQNLQNWLDVFKKYEDDTGPDTVFVGHSLGPAFILRLLEEHEAKAAFLVAGFIGSLGLKDFDPLNKSFTERTFNWSTIKLNCRRFVVINSDDDPYVPIEKGKELAEKLGSDLVIVEHAGHINAEFGFTQFPLLLEYLKKVR